MRCDTSKPYADAEDLLPLCFRCTATNPLVSGKGDVCISCGDALCGPSSPSNTLPMVEFEVAEDITVKEARKLIRQVLRVPGAAVRRTIAGAVIRG